ncbi:cubilin-like [Watersipora subatra]|uniref:cubilin-like n=1 Tax=Watersipora subatra TaxID=2589382 RepID=UPI00355AD2E5
MFGKGSCWVTGAILVISFAGFLRLTDGTECWKTVLTNSTGSFSITSGHENVTCYNFTLTNATGSIFFRMAPGGDNVSDLSSIAIYNINSTGGASLISFKSFSGDEPIPASAEYLTIGFGNRTMLPVARVFVNISAPLKANSSYVIGTYSNVSTACQLNQTLPSKLMVPTYVSGFNMSFTCTLNYSQPSGEESVYSFTNFRFTSPSSQLNVTSSSYNASFAGADLPYDFSVSGNLLLSMSVNSNTNDSFSASSISSDCFKMVTVNSSGAEIRSSGYLLGQYTNNLDCRVVLVSSDPNKRLSINVTDMQLAHDSDHLEVIDGGASRDFYTKGLAYYTALDGYKDKASVVVSSGDAIMLRFITDDLGTAKGYKLLINQTDASGTYYTPSTIEVSAKDFEMVLLAPPNKLVKLTPATFKSAAAQVVCYDGNSRLSPLVASYRSGLDLYAAFSTGSEMLCVVKGLKAEEKFNALADDMVQATSKLSVSAADSYSVSSTAAGNLSYDWIIQPDAFYEEVIELTIGRLSFSNSPANVSVSIASLMNTSYTRVSLSTPLPYIVRVPRAAGLRLSVRVVSKVLEGIPGLSFAASYTLKNSTQGLFESTGVITSPGYPNGMPALTNNTWFIVLPPLQALQFSFDSLFNLCNGSTLVVAIKKDKSKPVVYTGPMKRAPADLILNSTTSNQSQLVNISLMANNQCYQAGVKIRYTHLDSGYMSGLLGPSQLLRTPKFPAKLNVSYVASWVFSVPTNDSAGLLQSIGARVFFTPAAGTTLELRDGPRFDSPLIALNSSQAVVTKGNRLYVSYRYNDSASKLPGSPFNLTAFVQVCDNSFQCQLLTNQSVCMPASWKCDHIYQCRDGKDELGCFIPTTTPIPAVTKDVAKWWVVILCILAGIILGGVLGVVCILVIMRRRGRGYSQLNDLLTPVST